MQDDYDIQIVYNYQLLLSSNFAFFKYHQIPSLTRIVFGRRFILKPADVSIVGTCNQLARKDLATIGVQPTIRQGCSKGCLWWRDDAQIGRCRCRSSRYLDVGEEHLAN